MIKMIKLIKKSSKIRNYSIGFIIFGLALIFVLILLPVSITLNEFIIYCAFPFVGVAGAFFLEELSKYFDYERDVEPVLSIPVKYNISDASYVQLLSKDDCNKEIFKTRIYLKNSEKTPFYIDSILNSGNRYSPPMGTYFCEKGELICLMLPEISRFTVYVLKIRSVSNTSYRCKINTEDKSIDITKEKNECIRTKKIFK